MTKHGMWWVAAGNVAEALGPDQRLIIEQTPDGQHLIQLSSEEFEQLSLFIGHAAGTSLEKACEKAEE